ncbi:hydantoinase/oxoprolinase family protein [Streptosporangium sp. NPDC051023]|uniref:hydantoinase/oxoprolinase family protein n=1 Tax=Streptosporangium sp. NPDC051023 TaxID=3155410 RepID=UPI00344FA286
MRIGIDVGGTNTDAVLMDGTTVLAEIKTSTTDNVTGGVVTALRGLSEAAGFTPAEIQAVMIGTTHFTNAIVEGSRLAPTAAIRLGLPATKALPPMVDWPERLKTAIGGRAYLCHGGNEFDGRTISELRPDEIKRAAEEIGAAGVRSVAISSVFSPVSADFELRAAEIVAAALPDVHISLSHQIGRIGLLERENATIVNACLRDLADTIVDAFAEALATVGIRAPLYLSQNDGTLMDVEYTRKYPVATFASGPTNSMRGAALLSGLADCAVVDIGGTTTDVGVLTGGFPREAANEVDFGGVRSNFRMPDVLSIGVGGGSVVREEGVGPDSVGHELTKRALVFGGDTLTATDIAVAAGYADIGDPSLVRHLAPALVTGALDRMARDIGEVVDRIRTSPEPIPVVIVGGGSILVPGSLPGFDRVHRPDHFAVANAIGAAIAQVGGEVDRIFAIGSQDRDQVLDQAKSEAADAAVAAGARPGSVRIVEVDEVPLAYLPGNAVRVRVKAVGELQLGEHI